MGDVGDTSTAVTALPPLEALARRFLAADAADAAAGVAVVVRGRFVRRRKLSKALVFGDIRLEDGGLLEVMIRAQEGVLDAAAIRDINWDVKLGDVVTARGKLQRKHQEDSHHAGAADDAPVLFLLLLHSIVVDERWADHHVGAFLEQPGGHSSGQERGAPVHEDAVAAALGSLVLAPASRAESAAQTAPRYTNFVTIDGWNACKYYFSSAGGVNCRRGAQCHFWHGNPAEFALNRRRWLEARAAQRATASQIAGDDEVDPHSKAGKAHRARILCDWLVETLGEDRMRGCHGVLDVAGGKGDIPIELWNQRGIPTTVMDPRPMKLSKRSRRLVDESRKAHGRDVCPHLACCLDAKAIEEHGAFLRKCSLIVGMHPDEATEAIVATALELRLPFAVVPCCVMSRTFPDRRGRDGERVETYEALVRYLMDKHPGIQSAFLPFAGRNQVLFLFEYPEDTA